MPSASTTWPLAQEGSLTIGASADPGPVPSGFCVREARKQIRNRIVAVTGSCSGGVMRNHRYIHGITHGEFLLEGFVGEGSLGAISQESSVNLTGDSFSVQISRMALRKVWPLVEVTGSIGGESSDEAEFIAGIPEYRFQGVGWATGAEGPNDEELEQRIIIDSDQIGTIAFDTAHTTGTNDGVMLKIEQAQTEVPFHQGGGVAVSFQGRGQGKPSYTAGDNNWTWLFNPTGDPDMPQKVDMTLDTDGQETQKSTLVYDVTLVWNKLRGGDVGTRIRARWDKE